MVRPQWHRMQSKSKSSKISTLSQMVTSADKII